MGLLDAGISLAGDFNIPNPRAGIFAPVFSVKVLSAILKVTIMCLYEFWRTEKDVCYVISCKVLDRSFNLVGF